MPEINILVSDAKVMSKGQVTIPKKIREALGVAPGDRVTFLVDNGCVRIVNSAIYTLQKFQEQMKGEAEKAGFTSEEDIAEWISKSRRELHDLLQEGIHDIKTENTLGLSLMQCRIFKKKKKTLNTVNHSRVGMDLFPFYFHPYI